MKPYLDALAETSPSRMGKPERHSETETKALERFVLLYEDFSAERIREQVRGVYADDAYFHDPFHEVIGIDAIEEYFIGSTEAIDACTFDIQDIAISDGEYYVRWIMTLKLAREKNGDALQAVGMTHIRINTEGRVTFHQDYFDAGVVYERIPVLSWMIRKVKKRI